jgi:hypothetical protein
VLLQASTSAEDDDIEIAARRRIRFRMQRSMAESRFAREHENDIRRTFFLAMDHSMTTRDGDSRRAMIRSRTSVNRRVSHFFERETLVAVSRVATGALARSRPRLLRRTRGSTSWQCAASWARGAIRRRRQGSGARRPHGTAQRPAARRRRSSLRARRGHSRTSDRLRKAMGASERAPDVNGNRHVHENQPARWSHPPYLVDGCPQRGSHFCRRKQERKLRHWMG